MQWIPVGTDVTGRAAALPDQPRRRDAADGAELFPSRRGRLQEPRRISPNTTSTRRRRICSPKSAIAANPKLPEQIIKAHAEAIKRFYDDKAFAVKAYIAFDKQPEADVARIYDLYTKGNIFDRVPYVMAGAVKATSAQQADPRIAADLKAFDFHKIVDNSVVDSS